MSLGYQKPCMGFRTTPAVTWHDIISHHITLHQSSIHQYINTTQHHTRQHNRALHTTIQCNTMHRQRRQYNPLKSSTNYSSWNCSHANPFVCYSSALEAILSFGRLALSSYLHSRCSQSRHDTSSQAYESAGWCSKPDTNLLKEREQRGISAKSR